MEKPYKHFKLTIRERGGIVRRPSYMGCVDEEFLINFFGLREDNVESYEIKEVQDII